MPRYFRTKFGAPGGWLTPLPVPFQDFVVNGDGLSAEATAAMASPRAEAARLDFALPVYQVIPTAGREKIITVANWRHTTGEVVARFVHSHTVMVQTPSERTSLALISQFEDGRRLETNGHKQQLESPPNIIAQGFVDLTFGELLAAHRSKLEELRGSSPVKLIVDDEALARLCDLAELESVDHYVHLGICEWLDPAQISAEPPRADDAAPPPGVNADDAAVLAQIDRLQTKSSNWNSTIILAVCSLLAFIAIGGAQWDMEFALILAGVMVVHETGHYVAMRIFKYKDLRMFFIPLAGAAVTGRHYNVKGWQQAVVSLAGPVPGIIAGLILSAYSLQNHHELTRKIALVALFLNGINLLPAVPLDGGWIMNAIVFSRNFVLETVFLGCAGVALIVASACGYGRLWMYLGIFVLIGLPASHHLSRIAALLKSRGFPAGSPDDQTIPTSTTLAILQELRQGPKFGRTVKQLARDTLLVFQKLNARPPGALGSTILLAIYLGAGAAAFLGARHLIEHRWSIFSGAPPPTLVKLPE